MNTSRRSFLGGLAVASALTSATTVHAALTPENAELLDLGKSFDKAHSDFLGAEERLPKFQDAYRAIAPTGEGVLFEEHHRGPWFYVLDFYRDPTSPKFADLKSERGYRMMRVSPYAIDLQVENGCLNPKHVAPVRALALKFEQDVEIAVEVSGLGKALESYWAAESELRQVVQRVVEYRASDMDGIALKVRATSAYAALGGEERYTASLWLANAIWSDLDGQAA